MKTQKLTLKKAQNQGLKLGGGITGAMTQGAVSAVAKKNLPDSFREFVDPATIVAGVVISSLFSKNDFLEAAGFGMAFKPGWSIAQEQLSTIAPTNTGGNQGFIDTAINGAVGMARPTPRVNPARARTIDMGMAKNRRRNDSFSLPPSTRTNQGLDLSLA